MSKIPPRTANAVSEKRNTKKTGKWKEGEGEKKQRPQGDLRKPLFLSFFLSFFFPCQGLWSAQSYQLDRGSMKLRVCSRLLVFPMGWGWVGLGRSGEKKCLCLSCIGREMRGGGEAKQNIVFFFYGGLLVGWYSTGLGWLGREGGKGKNGGNDLGNLFMYHTVDVRFTVHCSFSTVRFLVLLALLGAKRGGGIVRTYYILEYQYDML